MTAAVYPSNPAERTRWILARRGYRNAVRADRPNAFFAEEELNASGAVQPVATIFLANRECPWKCVMCDLWRDTTRAPVEVGSIAGQIEFALARLPQCAAVKLYNSGSFFDFGAISPLEWNGIARLCGEMRVIVECHPRLVNRRVLEFAELLEGPLEVALGLETAHPRALERINKRITVEDYRAAAALLRRHQIAVRTFLLVHPPFIEPGTERAWLERSLACAFDAESTAVSLIPLRHGNGAVELLAREPLLAELEAAQELGIALKRGRVFADTWDLRRFAECASCAAPRAERIARINLSQRIESRVQCEVCGI